ncbi:MAG: cyclic 2,3-diphosphoglycerate synthase [bacterium]
MRRVLIMGAAGRDFHNFNVLYRDNKEREVVCFTATQIPNIDNRIYPSELAGDRYPNGIPIYSEKELINLIKRFKVDEVVFSYSDVSNQYVMEKSAIVNSAGADFILLGMNTTSLKSKKPIISICAVRTGCGKSQTSRRIANILRRAGKSVGIVRHPMPYGDLKNQIIQKFQKLDDLVKSKCSIEEMEDYEPHIRNGITVYSGVDYEKILRLAEEEKEILIWEGGNNDLPFYKPDLHIVVVDPLRVGDELTYYPSEANLIMADCVVINKIDSANEEQVNKLIKNIRSVNETADIVKANSPIFADNSDDIKGKRVLVVEDGPTLTHGSMSYGAGVVAGRRFGAKEMIDPRPYLVGSLIEVFNKNPQIGNLIPAMGYSDEQKSELEDVINNCDAELVIIATPIDLTSVINIQKPTVRIKYELEEIDSPNLTDILKKKKYI